MLFPRGRARRRAGGRILRRAGARRSAVVRRQRSGAAVSRTARSTRRRRRRGSSSYALMPHDRAVQRVRFFDQYRSYVINYNLGKDMVRQLHRVARRHAPTTPTHAGRSSRSCCRRRGCPPGCGDRQMKRRLAGRGVRLVRRARADLSCGLRLRLRHGPGGTAHPLRRVQLLRLPALVVHLPRPEALVGRRRLLRRRVPGLHRDHPVAAHETMGESRIRLASPCCRRRSFSPPTR